VHNMGINCLQPVIERIPPAFRVDCRTGFQPTLTPNSDNDLETPGSDDSPIAAFACNLGVFVDLICTWPRIKHDACRAQPYSRPPAIATPQAFALAFESQPADLRLTVGAPVSVVLPEAVGGKAPAVRRSPPARGV